MSVTGLNDQGLRLESSKKQSFFKRVYDEMEMEFELVSKALIVYACNWHYRLTFFACNLVLVVYNLLLASLGRSLWVN